jgi:hypothetical protein
VAEMHLTIPFYPNLASPAYPEGAYCQEMSLKMLLGYFEPHNTYELADIEKITGRTSEKSAWEMPYTLWLVEHGYEVKRFSAFDYKTFQAKGLDYIRDAYGYETAKWQDANTDVPKAQSQVGPYLKKITLVPKKPTIENIKTTMRDGYLVKAAVNSSELNNLGEYVGHFVVVTGFDDTSIWFHDPGLPPLENRQASYELFQKAMDSFGGEMDAIKKRA